MEEAVLAAGRFMLPLLGQIGWHACALAHRARSSARKRCRDGQPIELSPAELEAARRAMSPQGRLAGLRTAAESKGEHRV